MAAATARRRWRLALIVAAACVGPDDSAHIQDHVDAVTELPHGARGMVLAGDRYLDDGVRPFFCDAQHFDVESEAVDPLDGKERPRPVAVERLEAALRVP